MRFSNAVAFGDAQRASPKMRNTVGHWQGTHVWMVLGRRVVYG